MARPLCALLGALLVAVGLGVVTPEPVMALPASSVSDRHSGAGLTGAQVNRAAATRLILTPARPLPREYVTASGRLSTRTVRPVLLQKKAGRHWVKVTAGKTRRNGSFALRFRAPTKVGARQLLRISAPKAKRSKPVTSRTRSLRTVASSGTVQVPATAYVNKVFEVAATFTPGRAGRSVAFEQYQAGKWVTLATSPMNSAGAAVASLAGVTAGTYQYRARAVAYRGTAATTTPAKPLTIAADPVTVTGDAEPLSQAEAAAITGFDPASGVLTFGPSAPATIAEITVGDYVPVPPRTGLDSGALVRITSVSTTGAGTVFQTTPATLPEVVTNVPDDATEVAMQPVGEPVITDIADGVTVESGGPSGALAAMSRRVAHTQTISAASIEGAPLVLGVSLKSKGEMEGGGSPGYEFGVDGRLTLTPVAYLTFDTDWGQVKTYQIGAGLKHDDHLTTTGTFGGEWVEWKRTLATFERKMLGTVAGFPVYVNITVKIVLKVTASGEATTTIEWARTGISSAGLQGTSGGGLIPYPYRTTPLQSARIADVRGTGILNGQLLGSLDLSLYNLAGPYAEIGAEAEGNFSIGTGGQALQCEVFTRPVLTVGFRTSDALNKLLGRSYTPMSSSFPFAKNPILGCPVDNGAPVITTTSLPTAVIGQPYSKRLTTADNRPGAWSLVASSLPAGLSINPGNGVISGTPTGPTQTRNVQIRFQDGQGRTASKTFTLTVAETDPGEFDPALYQWRSIHSAGWAACGIQPDDSGWCWRTDTFGPHPPAPGSLLPGQWSSIEVSPPIDSFGQHFACGIQTDNTGWCWGNNRYATIGSPVAPEDSFAVEPQQVPGQWKAIEVGARTVCGVKVDGTGWCWGDNTSGQVGNGRDGNSFELTEVHPQQLPGLWLSLTPADSTTCGIQTDNTGWCWGLNNKGQVGVGFIGGVRSTPTQLPGTWRMLGAGETPCGIRADNTGWCWGSNTSGEVGDGTTVHREVPTQLPGQWATLETTPLAYAAATRCGVRTDGTGWCWGSNNHGQIGDGTTTDRHTPTQLPGRWESIDSDAQSTCGLRTDHSAWCWGLWHTDSDWALTIRSSPEQVPGDWRTLTLGNVGCGTQTDGTGWCWEMSTALNQAPAVEALVPAPIPNTPAA